MPNYIRNLPGSSGFYGLADPYDYPTPDDLADSTTVGTYDWISDANVVNDMGATFSQRSSLGAANDFWVVGLNMGLDSNLKAAIRAIACPSYRGLVPSYCPAVNHDWDEFQSLLDMASYVNPKAVGSLVAMSRQDVNIFNVDNYDPTITQEAFKLNRGATRITLEIDSVVVSPPFTYDDPLDSTPNLYPVFWWDLNDGAAPGTLPPTAWNVRLERNIFLPNQNPAPADGSQLNWIGYRAYPNDWGKVQFGLSIADADNDVVRLSGAVKSGDWLFAVSGLSTLGAPSGASNEPLTNTVSCVTQGNCPNFGDAQVSGTATPSTGDNATATFDQGTCVWSWAPGQQPAISAGFLCGPVGSVLTPTITWNTPAPITFGTPLSGTQLNATANVTGAPTPNIPGTYVYTWNGTTVGTVSAAGTLQTAGTLLPVGNQTLSVTFTPADPDYGPVTASVTLTVYQGYAAITWNTPAPITYGTPLSGTQLDAMASVPGTLTYTPVAGTVLGVGSHTLFVTFNPTDTTDYSTGFALVTLVVTGPGPAAVITWNNPAAITYGTLLSGTQLNATATENGVAVGGTFVYTPPTGTLLTAGTHTLQGTFTPTDTIDYSAASASVTLIVNKATPQIKWTPNPNKITYGTALSGAQLNATANVPNDPNVLPGTFVYNPAAGAVLPGGNPTLSVAFTPTDTTDYNTASGTTQISVQPASLAITWATPAAITYGTGLTGIQLNATVTANGVTVPGTLNYSPAGGTVLAAGTHPLHVSFKPDNSADYQGNGQSQVNLVVNKATPVITWANPADILYGSALGGTQLNADTTVPGTFTYTPPLGAVLPIGSAQTLSVLFTPTNATDYTTATATVSINVTQVPVSPANLAVTRVLSRSGGTITMTITIANNGGTTATNVTVTTAKVGSTNASGVPQNLGAIVPGGSAQAVVTVPGTVGSSGAASTATISGTYDGGTFNSSARITLP